MILWLTLTWIVWTFQFNKEMQHLDFKNLNTMFNYHNMKYYLLYCLVEADIAFNKPATASSTWGGETHRFGPQFVNNGKAVCDPGDPIAHTRNEAHPWFKVDLRGTFYIKTVAVLPRPSKFCY